MAVSSEQWRQYVSALCVLSVALFLGVPTWWKTTEVYRCPLPYQEIHQLATQQVPPTLVFHIFIAVLSDEEERGEEEEEGKEFSSLLQRELMPERLSAGGSQMEISFVVQPTRLGPKEKAKLLQHSTVPDADSQPASTTGHYTILLVRGDKDGGIVSAYRHAVVHIGDDAVSSALPFVVHLVRSVYGSSHLIQHALKTATGGHQVDAESMRQLRASQGYQLSFTLLNPDPRRLHTQWNIVEATRGILLPFLNHPGIARLGNFTVSSQVFYYTDTKLRPRRGEMGYYVTSGSLPPMISSVESKLGSHVSQLPSLHFLVYVPSEGESPLFIRDGNSSTDTFLVSQWGGVVIYNTKDSASDGEGRQVAVPMEKVMPVFIRQLKMLLGLPSSNELAVEGLVFSHNQLGISEWQVDQLLVAKTVESVSMATTSLISLVGLLDKVKNMVISDHIQALVESSLHSVHECYRLAGHGQMAEAYDAAKAAMMGAETAFFDPSILELLYFPDDQKFAIYIPLFLPISIPIVFSSITALKWALAYLRTNKLKS